MMKELQIVRHSINVPNTDSRSRHQSLPTFSSYNVVVDRDLYRTMYIDVEDDDDDHAAGQEPICATGIGDKKPRAIDRDSSSIVGWSILWSFCVFTNDQSYNYYYYSWHGTNLQSYTNCDEECGGWIEEGKRGSLLDRCLFNRNQITRIVANSDSIYFWVVLIDRIQESVKKSHGMNEQQRSTIHLTIADRVQKKRLNLIKRQKKGDSR